MTFLSKLINGVKRNTDRGREKILKDERRLKSSRWNSRTLFTLGFWLVVGGVIFLSIQATIRTGYLNDKINGFQGEAIKKIESLHAMGFADSSAGESYSKRFIETYITIPADPKGREQRANVLQGYLAEGMKLEKLENLSEFKGKRVLKSAQLYDVKDVQAHSAHYVYQIQYELIKLAEVKLTAEVTPKENANQDQQGKEEVLKEQSLGTQNVMMVVPLGTDGQSFNVIDHPYFQAVPSDTRLTAVQDQTDKSKKNVQVENELKQFATQFFTSYTTNSIEEMSYLMEQPEVLKDLYEYKGVEDFIVYNGDQEGQYIVKTLVILHQDGILSKHPFTLVVQKEKNKFYVKQLKHTLGG